MARDFIPHDYQHDIINWIATHKRCAVWAQMGSGKSVSTLTALEALSMSEDIYPVLVLATLRVAKVMWPDEIEKWNHLKHLRVSVMSKAMPVRRQRAVETEADLYFCNYEILPWLIEYFEEQGKPWPFKTIVADEATRLKSFRLRQGSKRAKALAKVAHDYSDRFIQLTGTPSPNGLKDLWGQVWFLDKGERLGRTYSAFEQRWFRKGYDGYSTTPMEHAQEEIQAKLKDVCLTVDGLPVEEPIYNEVYCELPKLVHNLYNTLEKQMFVEIGEHGVEAANAAVKAMQLLQLANGAIYVNEEKDWEAVHGVKLEALDSIITESAGTPVLVAYHFKSDLERLRNRFPKARVLDSDPSTIKDWNAGRIPILLAHPACLHPATEVLTQFRGWVPIVDVKDDELVHDGVEFVSHSGCSFSGVKPVMNLFGITLTSNHKLLVNGEWVEAKDVRGVAAAKRDALYTYAGDDPYLSAMLPLRRGAYADEAERGESQPRGKNALSDLHRGHVSSDDRDEVLRHLEGHEEPCDQPRGPGLPALRSRWARSCARLVEVRELLSGHVSYLFRRHDHRADEQRQRVQQAELSLGCATGAAGEQEQQVSEVYDLVDCGPRHRFLVRNSAGEVFISHNSAGHGLNLADGGNILAFFSLDWSLENYMQIIERLGPMRQKQAGHDRPVFIHHIICHNTIEEVVLERLRSKKSVQQVLLEAMKAKGYTK